MKNSKHIEHTYAHNPLSTIPKPQNPLNIKFLLNFQQSVLKQILAYIESLYKKSAFSPVRISIDFAWVFIPLGDIIHILSMYHITFL